MNTCDSINDYQSNFLQPRPFLDQNSKEVHPEESPSPNFFQFYNNIPYELELEDHMFFLQQQYYDHLLFQHHQLPWTDPPPPPSSADQDVIVPDIALNMAADDESSKAESNNTNGLLTCNQLQQMMPIMSNNKRASSKKDRHSKINTAKGPRDRRMRLSLDVARNFFDLQDMLGYDKASKTVEWLLVQATTEIKNLQIRCHPDMEIDSTGPKCASTTTTDENIIDKATSGKVKGRSLSSKNSIKKVRKTKHSRKIIHPLTKDSREKARARARERTSNKKRRTMSQEFDFDDESSKAAKCNSTDLTFAGSNQSTTEARKKETRAQTQNKNHSWEVEEASSQVEQPVNEIIDVDAMVIMGKWSPSSYLHHIGIPQEHQFGDFQ